MKQAIKILIIIELQVALVLLALVFLKQNELEEKVFNTNKFVFELLTDKRTEALKAIDSRDIVIGDEYAPVTLFVYTRYGCSACRGFFESVYPKLRDEYIERGDLKIVVRQAVQPSRPHILNAAVAAQLAYKKGCFDEFNSAMHLIDAALSDKIVDDMAANLIDCSEAEYEAFMSDESNAQTLLNRAAEARAVGIQSSPTFIIGDNKIVGSRQFQRFETLIEEQLKSPDSCE